MHEPRQTLIADFAIGGRLAYLSHQETLTLFQRALLRTGAPIDFSGGFNPRPRISIPLPRSVGTQSRAERLCAVLAADEPVDSVSLSRRLADQLPRDCELISVRCAEGKLTFHPNRVQYRFSLCQRLDTDRREYLAGCRDAIATGRPVEVQRWRAKQRTHRPFDILPFVHQLDFTESRIDVTCCVSQEGSVRIDELMQWLQLDVNELKEPVIRIAVQWNIP